MSQHPNTKDYIIVSHDMNVYEKWCKQYTSGNEKINNLIQEMQLKIDSYNDIVFEWISYNQFSDIKEISRGSFSTVYSAIWKDGPLKYNEDNEEYTRDSDDSNYEVALKCLHNSQNVTNEFLNEV